MHASLLKISCIYTRLEMKNCQTRRNTSRSFKTYINLSLPDCSLILISLHKSWTKSQLMITCDNFRPHERTVEDLEIIYEELLHIKALSHLSTMVKRELASVLVFESHAKAGTVCMYHRSTILYSMLNNILIIENIFRKIFSSTSSNSCLFQCLIREMRESLGTLF